MRLMTTCKLFATMACITLVACGGSGTSNYTVSLQSGSITGTLTTPTSLTTRMIDLITPVSATANIPAMLYLDDSTTPVYPDAEDHFIMTNIVDGDHTLFIHLEDGTEIEFPFRMANRGGLDFGLMTFANGQVQGFSGFNGYHFGWVDEDGDGVNDNFHDIDGDGICDAGARFAGYAYHMELGFRDGNKDGFNDHFADANGDGVNDLTGHPYGFGFGFVDEDDNGINDRFVDANGDGICDLSGMPFQHPFGWADENGDGVNDHFVDADGDGINDLIKIRYVAMPGWADLDEDGLNDFFADYNGDGINDLGDVLTPYGHGFGWIDDNGDGINDRFADEDGDGINDLAVGPFAGLSACYGYRGNHLDTDGDGFDDETGRPYQHGFGWIDENDDNINDIFVDVNGDGTNDYYGSRYAGGGYQMSRNFEGRMGMQDPAWPMGRGGGLMNF